MFEALGRIITARPKSVIAIWLVLILGAALAAFTGFGGKPLFAAVQSGNPVVEGRESAEVYDVTSNETSATILQIVSDASDDELKDLESRLDIAGVDTITSPQQLKDGIEEATTGIADAEAQVNDQLAKARSDAMASLEEQFGPAQAQIDQLRQISPAQADAAQAQLDAERAAAETQVDEQLAAAEDDARATLEQELAEPRQQKAEAEEALESLTHEDTSLILVTLDEMSDDEVKTVHDEVVDIVDEWKADLTSQTVIQSTRLIENSIVDQVKADLIKGEAIGLPVALFLMVVVFGGLIAAGLPLMGALTSIITCLAFLWTLTHVMPVDSFIINIISIIGLGLSIDYGLLVVSRYREEVTRLLGSDRPTGELSDEEKERYRGVVGEAVRTTLSTAGRTVFYSALTIAFSIAGLLVMEAELLRTIAIGGIASVLLAVVSAITLVPAVITALGTKLLRPSVLEKIPALKKITAATSDVSTDHGFFSRLASFVHARPWPILLAVTALLLVMAAPLKDMTLRSAVDDYIPAGTDSRIAFDTINSDFPDFNLGDITVLAKAPQAEVEASDYYADLEREFVSVRTRDVDGQTLIAIDTGAADPASTTVEDKAIDLRQVEAPFETLVGGTAAMQYDFNQSLADGLPLALAFIVIAVFILLFLMTGSLMVPLKALLINGLSLLASLGATVWLFEGGHFGLQQVPGLEAYVVAVALAFGFGLAMDYEVFLLARIKEYWDKGLSNDDAVERGLQRSGRIITSAAAIIVAVFIGFVAGDMAIIKQAGIALAIIVIVDATLVRLLLVPATMTLLGKWNWWAPKPLARIHERFGINHG